MATRPDDLSVDEEAGAQKNAYCLMLCLAVRWPVCGGFRILVRHSIGRTHPLSRPAHADVERDSRSGLSTRKAQCGQQCTAVLNRARAGFGANRGHAKSVVS